MSKSLSRLLRKEQFAFLGRDRSAWGEHLARVRAFLGEGLRLADSQRPVLVLGAGAGLELPWSLAPKGTTGWDADPWSRAWTALRHHRWPAWIFEDMTGGLAELEATARRAVAEPWSGHRRDRDTAARRLAGLLPFLKPDPAALRAWCTAHRPGTILCANAMGQFGVVAERMVEAALGFAPWSLDPEGSDPLAEAMDAWTGRALVAFLGALWDSGADLWLVHDRAVVFSGGSLEVGPWDEAWSKQLRHGDPSLEASDPLGGLDLLSHFRARGQEAFRRARWIWPVAPDQRHLVEALAFRRRP
ncbi:MAG TPA: hypothetical protein VJ549_07125 [Geothrix sp.]|nr:hypothetical protein [Geothrix sp.]